MRCIGRGIRGICASSFVRIATAVTFALAVFGHGVEDSVVVAQGGGFCSAPANGIVAENCLPGHTDWELGAGGNDASIQGFATDISVNKGQVVAFKIKTVATSFRMDIYRLGYYNGAGARKIVTQNIAGPRAQPDCLTDLVTGLVDCGNWAQTATWNTTGAVSGIYLAKLTRTDAGNNGTSHIVFVVRDDASTSNLLFQTSDTTWQAYNRYGGNSLYFGSPAGRAYKVSYNRPFDTRDHDPQSWLFNAEYPMVRWLEANGYDISYISGVDGDRFANADSDGIPATINPIHPSRHKVFLSVGHDEYWSGVQRTNVENARNAGMHLAFFSGNEVFWKTRFENSLSTPATSHRTLVTYKETHANAKIDPSPEWTGTWRDARFSPPADGGRPENALTGTIFTVNCCTYAITVPADKGKHRFWRNTDIATLAPGDVATLPSGTLGYEWDEDLDNGFRPAGLTRLSSTTVFVPEKLQDNGSTYAPGNATHSLTLYRRNNALVFGAGTVQWAWGLDDDHDRGNAPPDDRMQQATVNLFADMTVQPGSLQPGLVPATASTDTTLPASTIVSPTPGAIINSGSNFTISGTASDVGGTVAGVEISVDSGATWHPAIGTTSWTYVWRPDRTGPTIIYSRATDDSGNVEAALSGVAVTVGARVCPCTNLWSHETTTPTTIDSLDTGAVELGVKFSSQIAGFITGLWFYKSPGNTGTHVANLWTDTGTLLKTATYTNETVEGWQFVKFMTPQQITAGTTYVASYHTNVGHYSVDRDYFATTPVSAPPLSAPTGANGVFVYGPSAFPTQSFQSTNYWVDVQFAESIADVTLAISNVQSAAIDGSTAVISWTTNDVADSKVEYSLDPTLPPNETLSVTDAAFVLSHSLTLRNLTPGATYYFRITSVHPSGVSAAVLAPSFTVPGPTLRDTASIDFLAGTLGQVCDQNGANCRPTVYVGETGNGEVSLNPTVGNEFSGSSLGAGWIGVLWESGGSYTVSGGKLTVDGARVGTCDTAAVPDCESGIYGPGRSLHYVATFTGDPFQHAGFGLKFLDQTPRAVFTTDAGGQLNARSVADSGAIINTPLGPALLGTAHYYRIDWSPTGIDYWVDDVRVAQHAAVITGQLRPVAASDFAALGGDIVVDWIRMTPYSAAGSFLSRVFDARGTVDWHTVVWQQVKPTGTNLAISIRTGNTPTPDASWSAFVPVPAPGPITATSRYIQYRADLSTTDVSQTPELTDIIVSTAHAPVAVADSAATNDNTPFIFQAAGPTSLKFNDTDADTPFAQLRVLSVTQPAHGTTVLDAVGRVTYTPANNFAGNDSFTYTLSDGMLTAIGNVSIRVGAVGDTNRPPVANPGTVTTVEDILVTGNLSASDPDSNPLVYSITANGAKGTAVITNAATGAFTYTPNANANGSDAFSFKVNDGLVDSNIAVVTVAIAPANDAPTATAATVSTNENTPVAVVLAGSDVETAAANLSFTVVTQPTKGTLSGTAPNLTYTPAANSNGNDSFTFRVTDRGDPDNCGTPVVNGCTAALTSAVATVSIKVGPVNAAPTAVAQSVTTNEDTAVAVTLAGTDAETPAATLIFTIVTPPTKGTLSGTAPALTYTPGANFNGSDSFTFTVTDRGDPNGCGAPVAGVCAAAKTSTPATVSITVRSVNDAPSFTKGADQTASNTAGAQTVPAWATNLSAGPSDEAGQALSFIVSNNNTALFSVQPAVAANGTLTYTPAANQSGQATVTVQLRDNGGTANGGVDTSAAQTFKITITSAVAATQTTVTSSNNPSLFGVPVTFTATVTSAAGVPTGVVTFRDGSTVLGTATLAGGQASFTTSALSIGTHSITALYGGGTGFAASTSAALSQKVDPAATLAVDFNLYKILDGTSRPRVATYPVPNAGVKVFSTANSCTGGIFSILQPNRWAQIYETCQEVSYGVPPTYEATGTTNANGDASIAVPPLAFGPSQYLVIGKASNLTNAGISAPGPFYTMFPVLKAEAGATKKVPLILLATFNGKVYPTTQTELFGSYLDIIQPEYYEWTEEQEQVPIVMVAEEAWNVSSGVAPPSGFTPDVTSFDSTVADSVSAVQFTITDVTGADFTQTELTHVIQHKGTTTVASTVVPMYNKLPTKAFIDYASVLPASTDNVIDVLSNDRVAPPKTLTITEIRPPVYGTAFIQGNQIVYTPNADYVGQDLITYFVEDGEGGNSQAELWIRVNEKPALIIDDVTVNEGNSGISLATFTVSLSSPLEIPVTFDYTTVNGSADAGREFIGAAGTLVIPPGQTSKTIGVQIIGNPAYGGRVSSTFSVKLSKVANKTATIYGGTGKGTIVEDDPKPSISILPDVSVVEGNSGTTPVTLLLRLSGETSLPASITYKPANGTAKLADNDFVDGATTVTFAPGEKEKTITVQVVGDTKAEKNETFVVNLSGAKDAVIGTQKVTVTIVDDDTGAAPSSADPNLVEPASAEISTEVLN